MKKNKSTDFLLCVGALVVSVSVALMAALKIIETNTALVFLGLSVACIAMSLLNANSFSVSVPSTRKKTRK